MLGAQCLSCKKRRVRCDSGKPTCDRCPKDGLECPGYEKPTVWINHTQSSTIIKRSRHRPAEGAQRLAKALCAAGKQRKAPSKKLVPASIKSCRTSGEFHLLNEQKWFPMDEASLRIMDSVIYYNDCIAPFIVPDPAVVNWSVIPLDEWRCEPQLIKDIMLMIVSQHKAIRGQRDLDRDLEVCQQRNHTIQALNKQLSHVSTQVTDVALDAVMMLLTADIQYSAMGSWYAHVQGAAAIIELRGGWHKYLESSCENQYSASYFLSIEVMGGTTSSAQLLSQPINWPRGLAENFPDWDAIAVTACFPCPATLFHAISRINDLRASLFRQTSFSALTTTFSSLSLQSPHDDTIEEIRSILTQIKSFSASKWLPAVIKTLDFDFEPSSPDWLALTHCYHAATLLYCLRTLVLECPLRHDDDFEEALSSLLEDLFGTSVGEAVRVGAVRALFTHLGCPLSLLAARGLSAHSSAWNAVMWPLFIAGYEAGGDGLGAEEVRGMREFVVGKTKELAMLLGTRSVVDAQVILEKCWERREKGGGEGLDGGWTWDETFTKRCVFII